MMGKQESPHRRCNYPATAHTLPAGVMSSVQRHGAACRFLCMHVSAVARDMQASLLLISHDTLITSREHVYIPDSMCALQTIAYTVLCKYFLWLMWPLVYTAYMSYSTNSPPMSSSPLEMPNKTSLMSTLQTGCLLTQLHARGQSLPSRHADEP